MLRAIFIPVITLAAIVQAFSQNIEVTVVDSLGKPLSFVNVVVKSKADSTLATGGVTNNEGRYTVVRSNLAKEPSSYFLVASFIGYKSQTIAKLAEKSYHIVLHESTGELAEVVVTARRPMVKLAPGGISISLKNASVANIGTATDLLGQLPMISENNGAISVIGKGAPLIYVNGRQIYNLEDLRAMKSSDIASVKVITHPGAEYDKSVSSVLLITTHKPQGEGWSADGYMQATMASRLTAQQNISLQYRRGGLDLFGSAYVGYFYKPTLIHLTHAIPNTPPIFLTDTIDQLRRELTQSYTLGANYVINPQQQLGVRYQLFTSPSARVTQQGNTTIHRGTVVEQEISEGNAKQAITLHHVNLYYLGKMNERYTLKLDGDLYAKRQSFDGKTTIKGKAESIDLNSLGGSQLYSLRLSNILKVAAGELVFGGEAAYTRNHQDSHTSFTQIKNRNHLLNNTVLAGFISYSRSFGKLSGEAGVRYEFNRFDYYENGTKQEVQSKKYKHFFPSLSLAYNGWLSAQVSYNSSINRPSYSQLSSAVHYVNSYSYEGNNPYLLPTVDHRFALELMKEDGLIGAEYAIINNAIYYALSLYEGKPISFFHPENAPRMYSLSAFVSYQRKIGFWEPNVHLSVQKPFLTIGGESFSKPMWSLYLKNTFTLPYDILMWATYWLNSSGHEDAQLYKMDQQLNLQFSKKFLDGKISLSLQLTDLFNTSREAFSMSSNGIYEGIMQKPDTRSVILTFLYNFNNQQSKYQGKQSTDEINRL